MDEQAEVMAAEDAELITLTQYDSYADAHLVRLELERCGIYCFLVNENTAVNMPYYPSTTGRIGLQVPRAQQERALQIVRLIEGIEADEMRCPLCGSEDTHWKASQGPLAWSVMLSLIVTAFPFLRRRQCENCGHQWKA